MEWLALSVLCLVVFVVGRVIGDRDECRKAQHDQQVRDRLYGRERYPFHRD